MNRLSCISINHRNTPLEIREKIIFSTKDLQDLVHRDSELYALTTCNRTEIYWTGIEENILFQRMALITGIDEETLHGTSDIFHGKEAIGHLFRVSSGLDSLVLGETQILGQVKDAYRDALEAKTTSVFLNKALHQAFRTAKKVRNETDIGKYPISIASEAVELACHIFGDINKSSVLVIGAGDMAGIAAQRLKERGAGNLTILNRTHSAACRLAEDLGGTPKPFESLKEELSRCDILITSTGSPTPIITKSMMDEVMRMRRNRPLIIIDIAVPRDVDQSVGKCYNCYLYDIDALKNIVDRHLSNREEQAVRAQDIVSSEVELFEKWVRSLTAQDTIMDLFRLMDAYVAEEVRQSTLDGEAARMMEQKMRASLKRLMHRVVSFLKEHPSLANIEHTRRIFQLDADYQDRHKG